MSALLPFAPVAIDTRTGKPTGDAFAGGGGFTLGAEQAGARVVWAGNHWREAVDIHQANHPHTKHVCRDLLEYPWHQMPYIELFLASTVCQGHSQAGQPAERGTGGNGTVDRGRIAKKHDGDRATSFAVLDVANAVRPQTIVVENVPDMLRWGPSPDQRDGSVFRAWCGMLEAYGYSIATRVVNAAHYGGATERSRLIVTANLGAAIELAPEVERSTQTIGDHLEPDDAPGLRWCDIDSKPERTRRLMRKGQQTGGRRCFWANVSESVGRPMEALWPTATTQSIGGGQWYLLDGDRCRTITAREGARAMGFPDSYILPKTKGKAGVMIGNAIEVNTARNVVAQVLAAA